MRLFVASVAALCLVATTASAQRPVSLNETHKNTMSPGGIDSWWTTSNPWGPGDWFSVDFNSDAASCTVSALAIDIWSRGGFAGTFERIGIYNESTAFPNTPDVIGAAITELTNQTILSTDGFADLIAYNIPCIHLGTTDIHVAFKGSGGDSNFWIGSDTNETTQNRSFATSNNYNSGASAFGVGNWSIGLLTPPTGASGGTLWINGSMTTTSLPVFSQFCIMFVGFSPGDLFLLYFCFPAGVPFLQLLPLAFTQIGSPFFPGPCPNMWQVCSTAACGFVNPFGLDFCTIYPDPTDLKANGKPKLKVSNNVKMTVTDASGACAGCYGIDDDGQHDGFFFKFANPQGSSDWYGVCHGTASSTTSAGISGVSMTSIETGFSEFCGAQNSWQTAGAFNENTALANTPDVSDLSAALQTVLIPANSTHPGTYPANNIYDIADDPLNTTDVYYTAVRWRTSDSCVWIASDTDGTDSPCGRPVPDTAGIITSIVSANNFTTSAGTVANINWALKLNWN